MKTFLFNPYTGQPRHPLDIQSDPEGLAIHDPGEPLRAATPLAASAPAQQAGLKDCSHPSCGCEEGEGCKADKFNDAALNEAYAEGRKDEAEARAKGEPPSDELSSECLDCGGTGMRDSGGFQPWGEAVSVPCDCGAATPPQPVAAEVEKPTWASCQTRGPWVRNSLRTRLNALLEDEERIRSAYSKPFMAEPSAFIADSYAEAAEVFMRRLAALSDTGSDESAKEVK